MATITSVTTAISTSSGATLALTGVTAAVGDWMVLAVAADNAGTAGVSSTSATITDAAGNTWTRRAETNYTPGGAVSDGTTLGIWTSAITNALSSATITVNFAPNTTSKGAALKLVAPDAGKAIFYHSVGAGATGTATSWDAPVVSVALGLTVFGWVAAEATGPGPTDADTTNGSWSADQTAQATTGTAATSQTVVGQHKTVTATGNQAYSRITAASRDFAANWLLLGESTSGTLAATEAADVADFLGSFGWTGTLGATEDADTADFVGGSLTPIDGTLDATEEPDVASFIGPVPSGTLAATDPPDVARFIVPTSAPRGAIKSVRILVRFNWPDNQITRLWAGNGAFLDADGVVWRGAGLITGLDELERAVNGESPGITITLSGVSAETADKVWMHYQDGNLIDAEMLVLLQNCDEFDQPVGDARTIFTGYFINAIFDDTGGVNPVSAVSAEIANKFSLRRLPNFAVLSDADQKARSAIINPSAPPDRFAERVSQLENKTVTWPRFT